MTTDPEDPREGIHPENADGPSAAEPAKHTPSWGFPTAQTADASAHTDAGDSSGIEDGIGTGEDEPRQDGGTIASGETGVQDAVKDPFEPQTTVEELTAEAFPAGSLHSDDPFAPQTIPGDFGDRSAAAAASEHPVYEAEPFDPAVGEARMAEAAAVQTPFGVGAAGAPTAGAAPFSDDAAFASQATAAQTPYGSPQTPYGTAAAAYDAAAAQSASQTWAQAPYGNAAGQNPYGQPGQTPYGTPQTPYGAQSPYGQMGQTPYGGQGGGPGGPGQGQGRYPYGYYPEGGWSQNPGYGTYDQKPPKKKWPWILGGCLAVLLLAVVGFGGCVACTIMAADDYDDYGYESGRGYGYDDGRDYDYDYDYEYDDDYLDELFGDLDGYTDEAFTDYTLDEIYDYYAPAGTLENGAAIFGTYVVGPQGDIGAGQYYLGGTPEQVSRYTVFEAQEDGTYEYEYSVVYFDYYIAELRPGEVIAYTPYDEAGQMIPLSQADLSATPPYGSGVYRVGTDIPAGTYSITVDKAAAANSDADAGAFVMKDLFFDDDSITDVAYVIAGSQQRITVEDGEYLELYAAQATPISQ